MISLNKVISMYRYGRRWVHKETFRNTLCVRENVKSAVANKQPVVALESTIITHGMPHPYNLSTALSVEQIIRNNGGLPATVGIIDGQLIVGLSEDELVFLSQKENLVKVSRRDLGYVLSQNLSGGTTVAATMVAAQMAGISVFVTGGIGGVHRGASETFDISADLTELGKTPVAVVCAGIKSILDIGLTLEYLVPWLYMNKQNLDTGDAIHYILTLTKETQSVPVITYGATDWFPSFFTPRSNFKASYNLETAKGVAEFVERHLSLNLQNGMVIAVPIERSSVGEEIEIAIEQALQIATVNKVIGKEITPFVLEHVSKTTKGKSLETKNNAKVGAQIAVELAKIQHENQHQTVREKTFASVKGQRNRIDGVIQSTAGRPVVIGGSVFDIKATADKFDSIMEATNAGKVCFSFGGVGRNVAECLGRLGTNPFFISSVGSDYHGEMLMNNLQKLNMDTTGIAISPYHSTASYSIMANSDGELLMAVGDMDIHESISEKSVLRHEQEIKYAGIVVVDGNIPEATIEYVITLASRYNVPVWFEPTSLEKAAKPFSNAQKITYASPNIIELKAMYSTITGERDVGLEVFDGWDTNDIINDCLRYVEACLQYVDNLVITLGKHGVLIVRNGTLQSSFFVNAASCGPSISTNPNVKHYQISKDELIPAKVKSVSGAGDSFAAAMIYGILQHYDVDTCVKAGLLAASNNLCTYKAVSDEVCPEMFTAAKVNQWARFKPQNIIFSNFKNGCE